MSATELPLFVESYSLVTAIDEGGSDRGSSVGHLGQKNQSFTVTPAEGMTVENGASQQFTFSGITSDTVDIELFDCSNVSTDENGVSTFSGTNPGGTGNVAQEDDAPAAGISVVNGTANGGADEADSADGTISFTVDTAGTECFVAVVYSDTDDDDRLDLQPNGEPSEAFANSGDINVIAPEAGDNTANPGAVTAVNKAENYFGTAQGTFYYDANDEYMLEGEASDLAEFEQLLSVGDTVAGNYRSNAANQSTFNLSDDAPVAPATVTATGTDNAVDANNTGKGGIEVALSDSTTGTVAAYRVFRSTQPVPTVTGETAQCQATDSPAYSQVGTVEDDQNGGTYYFLDSTAQAPVTGADTPVYCYYVVAVDEAGDVSEPSNRASATADEAQESATNAAPAFTNETAATDGGAEDTIVLDYTEAVDGTTVDDSNVPTSLEYEVRVTDADGNVRNVTANITTVAVADDKVTLTLADGSFAADETVRVDVVNGADGNTVGEATTPTGESQLFQPLDDAVVATAAAPVV
jgi:hypothetical protein